ncbi:hypothetical protein V8C40DRAFT_230573 [Trichoderma camerunense]
MERKKKTCTRSCLSRQGQHARNDKKRWPERYFFSFFFCRREIAASIIHNHPGCFVTCFFFLLACEMD